MREADVIVVGAGFFGLTVAERLASESQKRVAIVDSRDHIGGNAHSYIEASSQVEVHTYGSHLFHTNNEKVWKYVSKFTEFNNYQHRVFAISRGEVFSLPVNLQTLSQLYPGITTVEQAAQLLASFPKDELNNFESKAISLVGEIAYNRFIKNYTEKQWQTNPRDLPAEIISRLPIRTNLDGRYFSDKYQGLPMDGYQKWQEKMVTDEKISIQLNTDFFDIQSQIGKNQLVIYTGPIDRYFGYKYGVLGWRTLDFETEVVEVDDYQGNSVVNYCDEIPEYTRIHEFKHLHPERSYTAGKTVIMKEFSRFAGKTDDPYYPINTSEDRAKLNKYREEAAQLKNVYFGGRLGTYQYLDMHMAIASALSLYENELRLATTGQ
ncbi:UDP-galactopyranose mutase [Actinobacteria bacterium IMCC26103]|nr:UDP-galactopyranose mutase [Actinobacteria bacterium IMCC26103]